MAQGRQPLRAHGAGLGIASRGGSGRRSRGQPLGGAGAQRVRSRPRPRPPVRSALGRSGLRRAAGAGPIRGGGASARAPDGRAPQTRRGRGLRGEGRGLRGAGPRRRGAGGRGWRRRAAPDLAGAMSSARPQFSIDDAFELSLEDAGPGPESSGVARFGPLHFERRARFEVADEDKQSRPRYQVTGLVRPCSPHRRPDPGGPHLTGESVCRP